MSEFARKQLEKYGWVEGIGLFSGIKICSHKICVLRKE